MTVRPDTDPERRRHRRHALQLRVEFGESSLSETGHTNDLSAGGIFVVSPTVPPVGTRLHLRLLFGTQRCNYFEVEVRRRREGSGLPSGFGARFLFPAPLIAEALESPLGELSPPQS